jgi:drug/metabolite transporter (DMT)-like permease
LASAGFIFVSGILKGDANITFYGIIFGILSGMTYGSYSIFGKYALMHYESFTVTAWAFVFAGVSSLFVGDMPDMIAKISQNFSLPFIMFLGSMGIITAFLPFLLYTVGLSKLDASKAIILASVEPLVATLFGIFVFKEQTDLFSLIGIFAIHSAVVLASVKRD